jgi:AcrR family transcriptional regulator
VDSSSEPDPIALGRTERRRQRTHQALVTAAQREFARRGVETATIQDITDAADVAKGSFYNHFESKEAILRAVVETTLADLTRALDRLTAPMLEDPARVISVCIRHTLRAAVANPTLGWFLLRANDGLSVGEAAFELVGRRDLERGIRSSRFAIDDLDLVLAMMGGAMFGVMRQRLRGELGPEADAAFARRSLQILGVPEAEAEVIARESLPFLDESPD